MFSSPWRNSSSNELVSTVTSIIWSLGQVLLFFATPIGEVSRGQAGSVIWSPNVRDHACYWDDLIILNGMLTSQSCSRPRGGTN